MTYKGRIRDGLVVLDEPVNLEDGTEVRVEIMPESPVPTASCRRSIAERLAPFIGKAQTLPPDASEQHDHYLYATPKT